MSLAAELLIARIADEIGPVKAFLSWTGLGCPLLDGVAYPPHRMAMRPLGGLMPGGKQGLAAWTPPFDLSRENAAAAMVASSGVMIVDAVGLEGSDMLWRALSPLVGAVRLRGAPAEQEGMKVTKPGFTVVFADDGVAPASRDHVLVRDDLLTDTLTAFAGDLTNRKLDEFDRLRLAVRDADVITEIRYRANYSQCHFHPVRALDQPDAFQLDHALGEGRCVLDRDGVASIALPQFAAKAAPIGITLADVPHACGQPIVQFDEPDAWLVDVAGTALGWQIVATPRNATPSEATTFELRLPGSPGAEISEVWAGITRRRAAWEDWDEADAQLNLEESW